MNTYKILLVEDNPFFLQMWHSILSQVMWSYKLDWAISEKAARKHMAKTSYDIIISDIVLSGGKTGIDIWKTTDPQKCTFIFATSIEPKKFASLVAGKDRTYHFLEKPLNIGHCVQFIHQLIQTQKRFKNLE